MDAAGRGLVGTVFQPRRRRSVPDVPTNSYRNYFDLDAGGIHAPEGQSAAESISKFPEAS
jgi:hypothetical protein